MNTLHMNHESTMTTNPVRKKDIGELSELCVFKYFSSLDEKYQLRRSCKKYTIVGHCFSRNQLMSGPASQPEPTFRNLRKTLSDFF